MGLSAAVASCVGRVHHKTLPQGWVSGSVFWENLPSVASGRNRIGRVAIASLKEKDAHEDGTWHMFCAHFHIVHSTRLAEISESRLLS